MPSFPEPPDQSDSSEPSEGTGPTARSEPVLWYRRPRVVIGGVVVAFVAAAVLTDLPTNQNQPAAAQSYVSSVESYDSVCVSALKEAFTIEQTVLEGQASVSDRQEVPGLLRDDLGGCSYTNEDLTDMQSELQPPGGDYGQQLGLVTTCVAEWEFPDANEVIASLSQLLGPPTDPSAVPALRYWLGRLASDSAGATAHLHHAAADARTSLAPLALPTPPQVTLPASGDATYTPPPTVGPNPCLKG